MYEQEKLERFKKWLTTNNVRNLQTTEKRNENI